MEETLRILHVIGAMDRGGAETMIMNLYRQIDRRKYQFDFLVHTDRKCDYDDAIFSNGAVDIRREDWKRLEECHSDMVSEV